MIEIRQVSKRFGDITALNEMSAVIANGQIFGLVGTNGSGKSTLLRLIAGVYKADSGTIGVDGESVYENPAVKAQLCLLPEAEAFQLNDTPELACDKFCVYYPDFDRARYFDMLKSFDLDPKRKLRTFSKGMKKQVMLLLGIMSRTRYLLCDETFDGLDPVARQAFKSLFATEMLDRDFTPVIASHNMRELEDICDHVGLLHKGRILLSENLEELKQNLQKVQCVLADKGRETDLLREKTVVRSEQRGRLLSLVMTGTHDDVMRVVAQYEPVYAEGLPLTLEEIFINETEVAGYDIKNLFL